MSAPFVQLRKMGALMIEVEGLDQVRFRDHYGANDNDKSHPSKWFHVDGNDIEFVPESCVRMTPKAAGQVPCPRLKEMLRMIDEFVPQGMLPNFSSRLPNGTIRYSILDEEDMKCVWIPVVNSRGYQIGWDRFPPETSDEPL